MQREGTACKGAGGSRLFLCRRRFSPDNVPHLWGVSNTILGEAVSHCDKKFPSKSVKLVKNMVAVFSRVRTEVNDIFPKIVRTRSTQTLARRLR